jgi:hypothetical protein
MQKLYIHTVSMPWQPLKRISIKNIYVQYVNSLTPPLQNYIILRGLSNKKVLAITKSYYFAITNTELQKALSRESRANGGMFDEKNRKSKIS